MTNVPQRDAAKPLRNISAIAKAAKPKRRRPTDEILELSPSARLVLIMLILRTDNETGATLAKYPTSHRLLGQMTGLAVSTVRVQLADLERREWLRIERRIDPRRHGKTSSLYHLQLARLLPKAIARARKPSPEAAGAVDDPVSFSQSRALLDQLSRRR